MVIDTSSAHTQSLHLQCIHARVIFTLVSFTNLTVPVLLRLSAIGLFTAEGGARRCSSPPSSASSGTLPQSSH